MLLLLSKHLNRSYGSEKSMIKAFRSKTPASPAQAAAGNELALHL